MKLKEQEVLNSFGITGGSNTRLTNKDVQEGFALWLSANNHVFAQVDDIFVSPLDIEVMKLYQDYV